MALINCKDCGRVCADSPSGQCAECYLKTSQAEYKVAEYLEDHQNSNLEEIHQATGVERHIIMQMIRKGLITQGLVSYPCENCQVPITKGRLCASCAESVLTFLDSQGEKPSMPERHHGGMYSRQIALTNGW